MIDLFWKLHYYGYINRWKYCYFIVTKLNIEDLMIVKKIIADHVYLKNFSRTTYQYDVEVDIPYLAGDFKNLVPKEKDTNAFAEIVERNYINDSFLFSESIEVGGNGLYYIILQKGYKIEKLIHEPEDVTIDLYVHKDGRLIYSFYNITNKKTLNIKGSICKDYDGIAQKITANLEDLYFRNYFIKQAQEDYTKDIKLPEFYPSNMNFKQVAAYLGMAPKTIQKWTSEKKIPRTKIGNSVIYRKKDIDEWLEKNSSK